MPCFVLVLRLGKSLDLAFGALASLAVKDVVVRLALVLAKINQAIYLLVDHKLWLIKVGVIKGDSKAYAKLAAKFWLVTITFNLMRNLRDLLNIYRKHAKSRQPTKDTLQEFMSNKPMLVDSLKNGCDVFLPLAGLDLLKISVGWQGVLGMTSSILAMMQTWDSKYKLLPA